MKNAKREEAIADAWTGYGMIQEGIRLRHMMAVKVAGDIFTQHTKPFRIAYEAAVATADKELHEMQRYSETVLAEKLRRIVE